MAMAELRNFMFQFYLHYKFYQIQILHKISIYGTVTIYTQCFVTLAPFEGYT